MPEISRPAFPAAGALVACLLALLAPAIASAEGTPAIAVAVRTPVSVLFGANATVSLEAENPVGQPYGYNLSYRAVLPKGVSFVAGSSQLGSGGAAPTPTVVANEPASGETTLIWNNVGDLSPASHNILSFAVAPSTSSYPVASTFTVDAGAYIASQPRFLPKFSATGVPQGPSSESFTGSATGTSSTTISAIEISQSEGSPEGELLRGVHDHQTVYRVTVTNNSVNATSNVSLHDWLPPALEYLGCGGAGSDHTTDAATNLGSTEEYPGSGPINVATLAGCSAPEIVETIETDPDGGGEDPKALYTHVRWNLGTLAAGETRTFEFRAAVALRENSSTWTKAQPSPASGDQAANLDNNSGQETRDGEPLITFAEATGQYKGETAVSAADHLTRVAKDITTEKSASSSALFEGQVTEWKIAVHSSEYRYNTEVEVEDTVPNGLCPLSSTNLTASEECEPDQAPSSPYASAVEQENGTWTLQWNATTDAALAKLDQNATTTISYFTKTRTHYQSKHKPALPLLANDSVTNSVLASATTNVVCANDTDCSGGSKQPIDHERPLSEAISDGSSASQTAEGPTIGKTIAESGTNCLADEYATSTPVYHPGDLICWRLEASFPETISTHGTVVTDFLPVSGLFDESFNSNKGEAATAKDTLPATTFEHSEASGKVLGGAIKWNLPESGFVGDEGQRFQRVYATTATLPSGAAPGELEGNLMKFASINSAGQTFALRSEANYMLQFPELSLAKDIVAIDGKALGPVTSAIVKGSDEAEFALTMSNSGEPRARDAEVWDVLPSSLECGGISAISNGGSCASGRITWGDTGLGQPEVTVAAKGQTVLHFTAKVPAAINPATVLEDHAGVVSYHSATNTGSEYTYVPAENIDTVLGLEANVPAANAHAALETEDAKIEKTHSSAVSETGNSATQATIGELVTFEVSAKVPAGTTLSGEARITDPTIPTARLTYEKGSAEALVDGGAAPAEFKVEEVGGSPVVVLPDDYAAPAGAARKVTLRFKTHVANSKENNAGGSAVEKSIPNTGKLAWTNPLSGAQTREAKDSVPLVEPSIKLTQANNAGGKPVHGGQLVEYTLTLSDAAGTSAAFDSSVIDTVPANVTPANAKGEALKNGEATASGGIWSAGSRTLTWELAKLAASTQHVFSFFVAVNEEPVSSTSLTNRATATTTSLEGESMLERTAANASTAAIKARYESSTEASLEVEGATVAKESDSPTATIGHRITYTLTVTLPAHVVAFDETVIDSLPDSLDFDEFVSAECTSGCPPEAPPEVRFYKPSIEAASTKVAWDLGNLSSTSSPRTVKIRYRASVRATHRGGGARVEAPATIENAAILYYNKTEKGAFEEAKIPSAASFDKKGAPVSAKTTIAEPKLTLVKELSVDARPYSSSPTTLTDGDTVSYRLTVANTGTSPAYGNVVTDKPPAALEEITPTENSADVTSNVKGEIAWKIPGPIAPGASVKLAYTAKLAPVTSLKAGEAVNNEAAIPSYFGASEVERAEGKKNFAGEPIIYREYAGPSAQVIATVVLPSITIEKTTGAAGFPSSANAEVNQPFTWRVVVKNSSTVAAKSLTVTDTLPANWEYVTGSASFAPGGGATPTQSGSLEAGLTLKWQTAIELAAGESTTLTYHAKPTVAAEATPGTGAGNPNINKASATVEDGAGNPKDADGPFAAGPAAAQAVLIVPGLEVTKTPSEESVFAGEDDSYDIHIHNAGSGVAREVTVLDTLPVGMTYQPGAATASPSAGFSEQSIVGSQVTWTIASIASGASVEVTVPVGTEAALASGSELTNGVAVHSNEQVVPVEGQGTIKITTSADVKAEKSVLGGGPAIPGEQLTYVVGASNNGPSVARAVKLTDTLPPGVLYVSAEAGCGESTSVVTCEVGDLQPGHAKSFQIVVSVPSSFTGPIANTVLAESPTPDPEGENNSASVEVPTQPSADLRLVKTALTPEVLNGQQATFSLVASNEGPSDAAEAKIIDTLPAGLTYVSATGASCTALEGVHVTCPLGTLKAHATRAIVLTVETSGVATYVNGATLASATEDPEPANNSSEASVKVLPAASLELEKTVSVPVVEVPGEVTYTLTARNEGPDNAREVLVTDDLPAGETYISDDAGCSAVGQRVACQLGELADGASDTIHLVVDVGVTLGGQTVTNTAVITSTTGNPTPEGATATVSLQTGPTADMAITKTGPATAVSGGPTPASTHVALRKLVRERWVKAGGRLHYRLIVRDTGSGAAEQLRVCDALPRQTTLVNRGTGRLADGHVCFTLATLAPGQSHSFAIVLRADSSAHGLISNIARVTGANFVEARARASTPVRGASAPRREGRVTG